MQIIKHDKPIFERVHMKVDDLIDKKLTKYPAIETCFSTPSTTLLSGSTGSGKTSFMIEMLRKVFKKVFNDIFLIIPEISLNSIDDKDNVFRKYLDPENIYHTYDVETLKTIYDKIEENSSEGYYSLLIIDDFGDKIKGKEEQQILESLFLKNRHLRLTAFLLCQNLYQAPTKIREITNNIILFNTNKSVNLKFYMEMFNGTKKNFDTLMKKLKKSNDYILCSMKHKKIYFNWDEVIFED
jgi:hypothetical protein